MALDPNNSYNFADVASVDGFRIDSINNFTIQTLPQSNTITRYIPTGPIKKRMGISWSGSGSSTYYS